MDKCIPYLKHEYRVFEHYFGKFFEDTHAICDCPDKETAERIIQIFSDYYEDRPFTFFKKEIDNGNFRR